MNTDAKNTLQQFMERSSAVLILPEQDNHDSLAASLAFVFVLEAQNKKAKVHHTGTPPEILNFLNFEKYTSSSIGEEWDAFITVGLDKERISSLSASYPSISILSIASKESKPAPHLASSNSTLKDELLSEVATRILKNTNESLITPDVASALLTGIVAKTQNFQSPNMHSRTMFTAAYLVSKKAANEKIARHLYKTKPLELVRLWGAAISRFSHGNKERIGWSYVTHEDIKKTGANGDHAVKIINELKNNFAQAEVFVLGVEEAPETKYAIIHGKKHSRIVKIASFFNEPIKNYSIAVSLDPSKKIEDETFKIISLIKNHEL